MSEMHKLTAGDYAPDVTVTDIAGNAINLADIWSQGTTLLTFLRHFG